MINIPPIECKIRAEYLYDFKERHGLLIPGTAFAVRSIQSNALLFAVMTDIGAIYDKLPISAFVSAKAETAPDDLPFHVLQLWDCLTYQASAVELMFLKGKRCSVFLKNKEAVEGIYRFTIDWTADASERLQTGYAEEISQHKVAHIIELETGHFCAYPNNRILWADPSSVSKPFEKIPDYKLNTTKYHCESFDKWYTEDSDDMFYELNK
jgi:hypothetical protein